MGDEDDDVALAGVEAIDDAVLCEADVVVVGPNSPLRYACTSVGRAVNQAGVLSSRNSDHSRRDTAGTLVRASARMEGGTAVARRGNKDPLNSD